MATNSLQKSFKYDVFLSFRGEDTRKNFVDHLYHALTQKGIETYKDDENIKQGKMISDELIKAIEDSKYYIIIFSKSYASSSWCLEELVKIMECRKGFGHAAYPVFYDVEPTEVRKQTGAFAILKEREAARKWREALKEASDLAGWELKSIANGHEAKFIQKIVQEISLELRSINFGLDEKLVGMETRVKDVVSSLETSVDDVRMIGIWGMGGAGKTTLARAIFDQISIQFEGESFIENVREVSKASLAGLKELQKQVLSDVLKDQNIKVSSVSSGKSMMQKMMRGRKVLVFLDDVDHKDQLEALAGDCNWFEPGSRIIITTRDEQVLVAHRVSLIHNVTLLSKAEAGCLFSRYAFGRENPIQGYEELSGKVLQYADGLPLTIKVMGSFLCCRSEHFWIDAIERLKTIPLKETLEKLELSYIDLEEDYKEIFLDVACILKGWGKEEAIRVLESRGFHAEVGLRVLEQKSLITISKYGSLGMHDHLEEMGRNIVRRSHPDEPQRHSRLWVEEEIEYILTNDLGTQATKCVCLWLSGLRAAIVVKGLAKMKDLRFIDINLRVNDSFKSSIVQFDKVSEYLPSSLRYMSWDGFPFSSLPNTFQGKHLVGLVMDNSNIVQLWEDGKEKVLHKLRFLRISCSKLRTFDLRLAPNLEQLTIYGCRDFVELHIPADHHSKLEYLTITDSKLTHLHLRSTPNLKKLIVQSCNDLEELQLPAESLKLEYLDLTNSKLRNLHLGNTPNLEKLILKGCNDLVELKVPDDILKLQYFQLSHSKLKTLHLGSTPNLERLTLEKSNDLVELQMPAESPKLQHLTLNHPKLITLHLGSTPNLETLVLEGCNDLVELIVPFDSQKLKYLTLSHSKLRTFHLGNTPNVEKLVLERCNDLVELQMPAESPKLEDINLSHSKLRTLDLGLTPNLKRLTLYNCYDLVEINGSVGYLKKLAFLNLSGCGSFKSFVFNKWSQPAVASSLSELNLIGKPRDVCPLHSDNDSPKFEFLCYYKEDPASSFGNLEMLISMGLCACTNLENFTRSICSLQGLRKLTLGGSIPVVPRDLDQLECLEELTFSSTNIRNLPDSICKLKHLKSLELKSCLFLEKLPEDIGTLVFLEELSFSSTDFKILPDSICMLNQLKSLEIVSCWLLEKLPDDIGRLESLEKLILTNCKLLQDIPDSVCKMKCINKLHLRGCIRVVELPEDIGCLEGLKELNIVGTGITCLPQSIFRLRGLRIVGSTRLIDTYGLLLKRRRTSDDDETVCYI